MEKYKQIPDVKPSLFTQARGGLNTDPGIRATKETDIFFSISKRFHLNTLSFFLVLNFQSMKWTSRAPRIPIIIKAEYNNNPKMNEGSQEKNDSFSFSSCEVEQDEEKLGP